MEKIREKIRQFSVVQLDWPPAAINGRRLRVPKSESHQQWWKRQQQRQQSVIA